MPKTYLISFTLLILILSFVWFPAIHAQDTSTCADTPTSGCVMRVLLASSFVLYAMWDEFTLPGDDPSVACNVTPSTGKMSGVNIRAMPDLNAAVIGDIPLDEYRVVSAISSKWYQTTTRDGRAGFVAASVTALVGPCGDVPQFIVTN